MSERTYQVHQRNSGTQNADSVWLHRRWLLTWNPRTLLFQGFLVPRLLSLDVPALTRYLAQQQNWACNGLSPPLCPSSRHKTRDNRLPRAEILFEHASRLIITQSFYNPLNPVLAWQRIQKPNHGSICEQNHFANKEYQWVVCQGFN